MIQRSSAPVGVADRALPVRCSHAHAHAAPAADPVAAAVADCARVPELSQRPLAAGAGVFTILPGIALCTSPTKLLELMFHPPEGRMEEITDIFNCQCQSYFSQRNISSLSVKCKTGSNHPFFII